MNEDSNALILAFDEWEAAADAVALARLDLARGLEVDPRRLVEAEARLAEKQAAWNRLAMRVQPPRRA